MIKWEVPHIHNTHDLRSERFQHHHETIKQNGGGSGELLVEVLPRQLCEEDDVRYPHDVFVQVHSDNVVVVGRFPADELVFPAKK